MKKHDGINFMCDPAILIGYIDVGDSLKMLVMVLAIFVTNIQDVTSSIS